jgi:hypothetical protein
MQQSGANNPASSFGLSRDGDADTGTVSRFPDINRMNGKNKKNRDKNNNKNENERANEDKGKGEGGYSLSFLGGSQSERNWSAGGSSPWKRNRKARVPMHGALKEQFYVPFPLDNKTFTSGSFSSRDWSSIFQLLKYLDNMKVSNPNQLKHTEDIETEVDRIIEHCEATGT